MSPIIASPQPCISDENFSFLQHYVHQQTGIVLVKGKEYLVETRLTPLVRKRKLDSLDALCGLLRSNADAVLRQDVTEAMTTNETLFFRDMGPFDALRASILPELVKLKQQSRTLSIWSAAASTGQEIYSIAMLLFEAGYRDWKLNLFATDYSGQVLERARAGRYMQIEVNRGLPAVYLVKYFDRAGLDWEIKPELRKLIRFEQFDLRKEMGRHGPFDIVFCRNVLIYFDVATKQSILRQMAQTLPKGAYLFLGATETMLNLDCPFDRVQFGPATAYRRR